eukprot:CAMPEP_0172208700 /NCGR_PEP_ID=MMETSP1050-20130122/34641_1 /TAXON_ID=233186 /ORGANISM="Cryptomonas curvata, Strain CCAP979/52" /LENGTH=267 /DNA_ID=CAMNT_0012888367 /DNA_START=19 /DNA_END=819 /DNA_ORIENTATION=+
MSGITVVFDFNRFFTVLDGNSRERARSARQKSKEELSAANVQEEEFYQQESVNTPKAEDRTAKSQSSSETSWSQSERQGSEQKEKHEWYSWAWTQSSGTHTTDSAEDDEHKAEPQSQGSFVSSNGWERLFVPGEEFMVDWRKWLHDHGLFPVEAPAEQDFSSVYYEGTGRLAEEARREAAETAKILWELRPQLEELARAARSSPESLLRHVYSRHPPRNRGAAGAGQPPRTAADGTCSVAKSPSTSSSSSSSATDRSQPQCRLPARP